MKITTATINVILHVDLLSTKDEDEVKRIVEHVNHQLQLLNLKNQPQIMVEDKPDINITQIEV